METLFLLSIVIYFAAGGFFAGYVYSDCERDTLWRKILVVTLCFLFGGIIILIYTPGMLAYEFLKEIVWVEIKFYYRVNFSNYYEDIRDKLNKKSKDRDYAYKWWNKVVRKNNSNSWIDRRMRRHVRRLNKKFAYTPVPEVEATAMDMLDTFTIDQAIKRCSTKIREERDMVKIKFWNDVKSFLDKKMEKTFNEITLSL